MEPPRHLPSTRTDAGSQLAAWTSHETVIGLRVRGTKIEHRFPPSFERLRVGRDPECEIYLGDDDSVGLHHATVYRRGPHLVVEEETAKNHTFCEGTPQTVFQLVAGAVVGFGKAELVAFSGHTQSLYGGLERYLGYGTSAHRVVEELQHAALYRDHLVLLSPRGGGAIALARYLHHATPGNTWPFVERPKLSDDVSEQVKVLKGAAYGTIVLGVGDLPDEREFFLREAKATYHVRLVLVCPPKKKIERFVPVPLLKTMTIVSVAPLASRRVEISRVVSETIAYHLARQGATTPLLTEHDHERIEAQKWPGDQDELDDAIYKLVLVRKLRHAARAASVLGVTPARVSQWADKYGFRLR